MPRQPNRNSSWHLLPNLARSRAWISNSRNLSSPESRPTKPKLKAKMVKAKEMARGSKTSGHGRKSHQKTMSRKRNSLATGRTIVWLALTRLGPSILPTSTNWRRNSKRNSKRAIRTIQTMVIKPTQLPTPTHLPQSSLGLRPCLFGLLATMPVIIANTLWAMPFVLSHFLIDMCLVAVLTTVMMVHHKADPTSQHKVQS